MHAALLLTGTLAIGLLLGWSAGISRAKAPVPDRAKDYAAALDAMSSAVVFIYKKDDAGKLAPSGTGFLVAVPSKSNPRANYVYLVTARHMVDGPWQGCSPFADHLVLRLNKAHRESVVILELGEIDTVNYSLEGQEWDFPDENDIDLAFTLLSGPSVEALGADFHPHPISSVNLATKEEADNIRVGDEVASAGLLSGASGEWRNFPIVKWGRVSSVRSGEPLFIPSGCGAIPQPMRETLLAASLVPGNSGSPILFLPSEYHPGRSFIAGVQSISFIVSDVAGMSAIRPMLDSLRRKGSNPDMDLGPPDAPPVLSTAPKRSK